MLRFEPGSCTMHYHDLLIVFSCANCPPGKTEFVCLLENITFYTILVHKDLNPGPVVSEYVNYHIALTILGKTSIPF